VIQESPSGLASDDGISTRRRLSDRVPANTDQGSQFTSFAFTNTLQQTGIRVLMDGRGRWMENVFIERLWRSLKYECVYLNAFESGSEARTRTCNQGDAFSIATSKGLYNVIRPCVAFL
jgi:transposase InsO family protein